MAAYLQDRPLDAIYASPMLRARQTAAYIVQHHPDQRVRVSSLITETHTPHEGQPLKVLEANGWRMFEGIPEEYEQPADILNRAQRFIQRMRKAYPNGEVAAVSHGELLLWMHLWTRGLDFTPETQFEIQPFPEPASVTTLTFTDSIATPADLVYHRPY